MVRAGEEAAVPVLLYARPPVDAAEERTIRKLAGARHAPGDWIRRARMIAGSWDGLGTTQIADRLGCHPQTVRERLHQGGEGLLPPAQPEAPAHWTLDALAAAAQAEGIRVGRSQIRRILLAEGTRWRRTRSWTTSPDPEFAPKGRRSSPATPPRRRR